MRPSFLSTISAVTFDDFNTLRYSLNKEDVIYPILRALGERRVKIEEKDFLREYVKADKAYRKSLRETFRESLLDDVILNVLTSLGYQSSKLKCTVTQAVNEGLATRKAAWYPDALPTLKTLREMGYKLGLITNTHWRIPDKTRKEFEKQFDVITLSYEHGYAKPHPSFLPLR